MTTEIRYPNFLTNRDDYASSAELWREAFNGANPLMREVFGWRAPWVDESWHDANPIFSAWSPQLRRGLRIVQHTDPDQFVVWQDIFARGQPEAIEELVISCVLTDENLSCARELIAQWVSNRSRVELTSPVEPDLMLPRVA